LRLVTLRAYLGNAVVAAHFSAPSVERQSAMVRRQSMLHQSPMMQQQSVVRQQAMAG
jgi:hypothetical protein